MKNVQQIFVGSFLSLSLKLLKPDSIMIWCEQINHENLHKKCVLGNKSFNLYHLVKSSGNKATLYQKCNSDLLRKKGISSRTHPFTICSNNQCLKYDQFMRHISERKYIMTLLKKFIVVLNIQYCHACQDLLKTSDNIFSWTVKDLT